MAKIAFIVLALAAVAAAKPLGGLGGAVVSKNHHVTSSVISPYMGLGLGYPLGLGLGSGHVISSSIGHSAVLPHYGLGLGYGIGLGGIGGLGGLGGIGGLKGLGYGMYPGIGYGLLG